jgi:RNA polymerase sigma-70 factor (ECF subfamily)
MTSGSQPATGRQGHDAPDATQQHSPSPQLASLADYVAGLYAGTDAARFQMSIHQFTNILSEVVDKYAPSGDRNQVRELLDSLKVGELVLARACVSGNEQAWETLLTKYREQLYDAANSISRDYGSAREIADSLYAELYGLTPKGEQRTSKLVYYTGIGSLAGWLRTVLAQSYIDRYRRDSKLVSIDEKEEEGRLPLPEIVVQPQVEPAVDPRLDRATDAAFAELDPEDRLLLSSYFLDGQTLAEIAALVRKHESTVSRRLEKITTSLHKKIRMHLLRSGMSSREADEAFKSDVRDLRVNISARLKENSQKT